MVYRDYTLKNHKYWAARCPYCGWFGSSKETVDSGYYVQDNPQCPRCYTSVTDDIQFEYKLGRQGLVKRSRMKLRMWLGYLNRDIWKGYHPVKASRVTLRKSARLCNVSGGDSLPPGFCF